MSHLVVWNGTKHPRGHLIFLWVPFTALEMSYCRPRICIQKTVTILLKFIVTCSHNVCGVAIKRPRSKWNVRFDLFISYNSVAKEFDFVFVFFCRNFRDNIIKKKLVQIHRRSVIFTAQVIIYNVSGIFGSSPSYIIGKI